MAGIDCSGVSIGNIPPGNILAQAPLRSVALFWIRIPFFRGPHNSVFQSAYCVATSSARRVECSRIFRRLNHRAHVAVSLRFVV